MRRLSLFLAGALCVPALAAAITAGQVDDFQDGTLQGWGSGLSNPNGPANENGRGPGGEGDRALVATATGGPVAAGAKIVIFNQAQWTGNFLDAGVNALRADLHNLSDEDMTIRVALRGSGGAFATVHGVELPGGEEGFVSAAFSLAPEDLTWVGDGSNDVMATLGSVTELRILHTTEPDQRGDPVEGQLAVDNVTALDCASGLAKADSPADFLLVPAFEVDTADPGGLTTFFAVHNQSDQPRSVLVRYFDRAGKQQRSDELALAARQTRSINVRGVQGLAAEPDGFARGSIEVRACSAGGDDPAASLTGDFIYLDDAGNFATGDQLLRREDVCSRLQVRLLNFGSGIRLRLYAGDPQGLVDPTATFTVYNEAGAELDKGEIVTSDQVSVLDSTELTATRFGTLDVEFAEGGGALSVEYSAFGRFSVAMNATCVEP